ncbi:hypothetical protein B0H67DRAFT_573059 [Lasiosphaeris hirsuta]|uniref:RTA1 domain protein n=1 Tax=Lasiosphaeris hirsuta TaxID=260670 RepID=A0AA40E048_9PEZI|nr:hypothetical protein B0H67DRAFT_573059 [Lasiosphaeris hirsuta]
MSKSDGQPVSGSIYFYAPNQGAPVFFAAAFAASGLLHLWQCIHYKCFKLTALLPFCCLLFSAGFAAREYGAFHYDNLQVYIASTLLIYMSPPILELANYHTLGRVLYYVPYFAPIHPGRVLTTFATLSSVVEVLNAIGVSYLANRTLPDRFLKLGDALMKVSLVLQIIVISLFFLLAAIFHHRCRSGGVLSPQVKCPLVTLYVSMLLILGRTIYRMVEHFGAPIPSSTAGVDIDVMDFSPAVLRYEWFFYVFEATLMLANSALWNAYHPRRYLPKDSRVYLAQDGRTELEGPGWKDQRPWVVTCLDPFGLADRKDKEKAFWEHNGFAYSSTGPRDSV